MRLRCSTGRLILLVCSVLFVSAVCCSIFLAYHATRATLPSFNVEHSFIHRYPVIKLSEEQRRGVAISGKNGKYRPSAATRANHSLQSPLKVPDGVLNFLFLAYASINFAHLWNLFFVRAASQHLYRIFVHCTHPRTCKLTIQKSFQNVTFVKTVLSSHCNDLVTPMNALLRAAGAGRQDLMHSFGRDLFVFVSDTTIPVKPFHLVYQQLMGSGPEMPMSSFCIVPPRQWGDCQELSSQTMAVKHHQWVVLTREHAARSLLSEEVVRNRTRSEGPLTPQGSLPGTAWLDHQTKCSLIGCLDEYWHFQSLYGTILQRQDTGHGKTPLVWHALKHFAGEGVQAPGRPVWAGDKPWDVQGRCWTYVYWGGSAAKHFSVTSQALSAHVSIDASKFPAKFVHLSKEALHALRRSPFLFARKFEDGVTQMESLAEDILLMEDV